MGQEEGLTSPQRGAPTHTVVGTQAMLASAPYFCLPGHGVPMDIVPRPEPSPQVMTPPMPGFPASDQGDPWNTGLHGSSI